jgi:hypothetical protein
VMRVMLNARRFVERFPVASRVARQVLGRWREQPWCRPLSHARLGKAVEMLSRWRYPFATHPVCYLSTKMGFAIKVPRCRGRADGIIEPAVTLIFFRPDLSSARRHLRNRCVSAELARVNVTTRRHRSNTIERGEEVT